MISKLSFTNWHVLRENCMRLIKLFLDSLFEIQVLHDILELVGTRCCTFSGESINLV